MEPTEQASGARAENPALTGAPVRNYMSSGVVACEPSAPVARVAELMAGNDVHCVIVAGITGKGTHADLTWGLVSDLDVVCALSGKSSDTTAAELARRHIFTAEPEETMLAAAERMATESTTHLVVVEDGRPVGVVSSLDVARAASLA